jgi:hypothetical protein
MESEGLVVGAMGRTQHDVGTKAQTRGIAAVGIVDGNPEKILLVGTRVCVGAGLVGGSLLGEEIIVGAGLEEGTNKRIWGRDVDGHSSGSKTHTKG